MKLATLRNGTRDGELVIVSRDLTRAVRAADTIAGLGTLLSSKVNQWTLLVGSLPIVFAISASHLSGLPLDSLQREELFLTAAQSVFAIAVLANRSMSVREAWMMFGLFVAQFVLGGVLPEGVRQLERIAVGIAYLVLAAVFFVQQRAALKPLVRDGLVVPVDELFHEAELDEARS